MFGLGGRRDGHVQPQHVGLGRAGEVLEPGDQPRRDAGEQDRQQVGPVGLERGEVREHARVEHRQQLGQLGLGDVLGELGVAGVGSIRFH